MKKFYVTTPIYYPSGKPHIGHAYSTLVADVLARYKKILNYDVYFLTGTDEHGQKIEEKAKELNISPQQLVDQNSDIFNKLWKELGINYSSFIRTSFDFHKNTVKQVFSILYKKGYIYLGEWEGHYCVSCEENYTKTLAKNIDNKLFCQHGHELILKKEESYFLKTKEFKKWIIDFLKTPNLVYPENRINELLNSFLTNDDFDDLSISRTTFNWGISIDENPKHVMYVWLDALLNYITALGYLQKDDSNFKKFWQSNDSEIVHIMSKEITRFHCIYWPIILEMLNLKKPTKYISHGWIITDSGKMSKSLGNVIDPFEIIKKYNRDTLRYYLCKEISFKDDSTFSEDNLINTYNNDLANNFGNLINRTIGMHKKYCNLIVPKFEKPTHELSFQLFNFLNEIDAEVEGAINKLIIQDIIKHPLNIINKCNLFIENIKPWNLVKENNIKVLNECLSLLIIAIKKVVYYLQPILIDGTKKALNQLNINENEFTLEFIKNPNSMDNRILNEPTPIFIRIEK